MALTESIQSFEIPFGKEGMRPRPNRLLVHPIELLDAQGVTFEDDDLRKEAGATKFDATGLLGSPVLTGTLSAARKYDSTVLEYSTSSSSAALIGVVGTAYVAAAASATITVTVGGGDPVSIGDLVFVSIATTSDVAVDYSIADTGGNTYTKLASTVAVAGLSQITFWVKATVALVAGNTIVVTDAAGAAAAKAMVVCNFSLVTSHVGLDAQAGSNTTTTAIVSGPSSPYAAYTRLAIVGLATLGADTDTITIPTTSNAQWAQGSKKGTTVTAWLFYRFDILSPGITGLYAWHPTSTVQRIITVSDDGNIYKEVGGDLDDSLLASGLFQAQGGVQPKNSFFVACGQESAALNRRLLHFNGYDQVRILDGDGLTMPVLNATTQATADWTGTNQPTAGGMHQFRPYAFGNLNRAHTIYFANPDDHADFRTATATSHINCDSSIGDRVRGSAQFQGLLHFWKYPRGIFWLDDSDLLPANWQMRTKSSGLGCADSPYAVCAMDDDVIFMSADGQFHLLSAVNTLGGTRASSLSRALGINKWIQEHIAIKYLNRVLSIWYPAKKVATFWVPTVAQDLSPDPGAPGYTLKFDFGLVQDGGPVRFSWSDRDLVSAATFRRDDTTTIETPIMAEGRYVYLLDQAARSKNGSGYTSQIMTPHHDLSGVATDAQVGPPGAGTKRKIFEFLELVMNATSGTITVTVYVDQVSTQTLTFDGSKLRQRKKLFCGDGYTIAININDSGVSDDPAVLSAIVWFKYGNEDQSR